MKYKLIVFDMDGTLTTHVSSWQLIHEKLGVWDTKACEYQKQFIAGKISYRMFCALDAAHWRGLAVTRIEKPLHTIPYTKNAKNAVKKLKGKGFKTALLSTGLDLLAQKLKTDLSLDYCVANKLKTENGILTGKVTISVSDHGKARLLEKIARRFHVSLSEVIFIGDGRTDIPAAKISGYSIAFNSSVKELRDAAHYVCQTTDFLEVYEQILAIEKK